MVEIKKLIIIFTGCSFMHTLDHYSYLMEKAIHVFIADDEYQSRLVIVKLLSRYFAGIQVVGQVGTVTEAVEGIRNKSSFLNLFKGNNN